MRAIIFSALALALMTACGNTDRPLRDMRSAGGGPDEFQVIPVAPLEIPDTLSLPEPTPGGPNRTDPQPNADAVAALGGRASAQVAGGIPAGDGPLVAQAGRYGVDPAIRSQLAAEDERIRDRARRSNLFNPLNRDKYFPAYVGQALDPRAELARLRNLGVAVPNPPVAQPQVQPRQTATEEPEEEPRFLQRTLDAFLARRAEEAEAGPQECVWRTTGPDNVLRRVCTPIVPESE